MLKELFIDIWEHLQNSKKYRRWFWIGLKREAKELWKDADKIEIAGFVPGKFWLGICTYCIVANLAEVVLSLLIRLDLLRATKGVVVIVLFVCMMECILGLTRRLENAHRYALTKSNFDEY